jgi:hypothetical protein
MALLLLLLLLPCKVLSGGQQAGCSPELQRTAAAVLARWEQLVATS